MPRVCKVCAHPDVQAINAGLVGGQPLRELSALYRVSEDSLTRHKAAHLPAVLSKAQGAADVTHADDLLGQVRTLQTRTLGILAAAEGAKDLRLALQAIREARGNLELLGKLAGELQEAPIVNLLVMPEWVTVRGALLRALIPYPEARAAVAGALQDVDRGHSI